MKDLENLPKLRIRGQIAPKDSFMTMFGGESCSASDVSEFLIANKAEPEIVVEISSPGGYRSEGVEIYNLLKTSGKKITTIAFKANSIATVIMLAGETRLVVDNLNFIVHFARIDPMDLGVDALTSEDLQRLADETERADRQILDIYCSELGEEKRTELVAAMADEKDLGAKGAIKLGFATGYYKKKKKVEEKDFAGVLITDHLASIIQNHMSKEKESQSVSDLEKLIKNFKGFLAKAVGKIKNEVTLTLTDGKQVYVVPADPEAPDNLLNGKVYEVDEAGMPTETPVADNEYTLDDGRVLVVAAGVVTEVRDALDVKKLQDDLKAKQEALTAANAEIQNLKTQMETDKTAMKTQFDLIQNKFNELKAQVPGDKKEKDDTGNPDLPKDFSKMTTAQRVRAMSKERAALEKQLK